ncbi:hypothetical protein Hypma_004853 [Hypsizygus marmoreus]|uniref:F-box domain-containing protein n=1 Tax=Hypsizygus marmoreus TaxID=39966 RepID=A0A369J201_HYPMA|nr:hypothetical protein Hypma_004853 [Hypsizygus marmoreus]
MRSPHVITHVCSEWRHVALSTPMLWATIMVDYEDYDSRITSRSPDNDERLHTWLGRTGTYYPLDIAFVGPPRYESIIGAPLSWISSYMHRIKALDLSGIFSGLLTSRFEILEALALANHEWHVGEDKINQTMFPSLRRVVLHEEDELTPPRFIPWPQLTHLSLNADSIVPATLWIMLSQSLELVELHISLDSVGVANGEDDAVVPAINDPVILPHLDTLSVTMSLYNSLLSRSSFFLKSFKLGGPPGSFEIEPFLDIIRRMPSLTQIDCNSSVEVTPTLVASFASLNIAPNLEYLRMSSYWRIVVEDDEFLHMVSSRDRSGEPAVAELNLPPYTRIFRSHMPKRPWSSEYLAAVKDAVVDRRVPISETVHIYF